MLESDIGDAQAEIDQLLAVAGVKDASELPELEARATRARLLRKEIEEAEEQVAEVGEGRFADLAASAEGFDRDEAAIELEALREQSEELRARRDEIEERIGERRRELADVETDVAAVQAAQDVTLARAAVQEAAVAHAKARLAAAVVRRAMERYRAEHQDPLLRRATDLFKRFTLGSFVELFVDVDERGAGVLIGRQRDRVLKRVPQMSKGTREQLFLALPRPPGFGADATRSRRRLRTRPQPTRRHDVSWLGLKETCRRRCRANCSGFGFGLNCVGCHARRGGLPPRRPLRRRLDDRMVRHNALRPPRQRAAGRRRLPPPRLLPDARPCPRLTPRGSPAFRQPFFAPHRARG